MELSHCSSFGKVPSTTMPPSDFLDKVHMKAHHQPGSNMGHSVVTDVDVDLREIYFLIMHFLSSGPCQRTFTQFCNELLEYQLLPRRYHAWYSRNGEVNGDKNDDGISLPLSYESVVQRYSHVEKDHLVKLLKQLILNVAPSRGIVGRTTPSAADVPTLLGIGSFSLLGCARNVVNVHVKPLPAHLRWPHMQASQVHGIGLREIGGGFPKHHRAPSIRFACYAIAKPSTMVQKMQNIKKLRGHRDAVYCAIFDRSGRYVITGSDDRLVKVWSMETGFCLASCRGHEGDITDLAVNLNNTLVASASNDFNIRVWRLPDGYPISVLRGHTGAVTAIAFSPRHNSVYQLLSSSDDGTCRIWDARSSQLPPRTYLPRQTDIFAGRNSVPSASNGPSTSNTPQNHQILCCAYNANGTVFVTGSSDTLARVWSACKSNVDDSQQPTHEIDILAGHENDVNYVQFSGCAVASRSFIPDSCTNEKVPKFKNSWYSHDNIVTCSRDGSAIIWIPRSRRYQAKVARWTRAYHLKVPPPPMPPQPRRGGPRQRFLPTPRGVNMIVWSLDNRFVLAAIMDCRICVWNAADGSLVHSLTGHSQSTYVLDVHPFNPRIAMSAGYDGKTIIWDIWEGIPIRVYEIGRFKLVDGKFSPDGTSIVLSDDVGQIYLLNTGQGESQKDSKYAQFFLGDYRPFGTDAHGIAIDKETQLSAYRRNIQDSLCDASMLPYPEPYQSNYQRRRLGALNLEWRPPSIKFAIGTDIGLGQEYQILPLADLDVVAEPLPEFIDAMFWEPENDVIVDTTDSEYNVTDEYSSEDEQGSLSNSSSDAESSGANIIGEGSHRDSRRRSKRKKSKDDEWTFSSVRRAKKRNLNEHEGPSSRSKRTKRSRNGGNTSKRHSDHLTTSRPQRVSARNVRNFFSRSTGAFSNEKVDDLSEDDSSEESWFEDSSFQDENLVVKQQLSRGDQSSLAETVNIVPPNTHPEARKKLVLKFSVAKKPAGAETSASQTNIKTDSTSSRLEEDSSKFVNGQCSENPNTIREKEEVDRTENHFEASAVTNDLNSRPRPTRIRIKPIVKTNSDVNVSTSGVGDLAVPNIRPEPVICSEMDTEMDDVSQRKRTLRFKVNRHGGDGEIAQDTLNARNHDNETDSEAATDAMRRSRSLKLKAGSRETDDTFKIHKVHISLGTSRSAEKSSKIPVNSIPTFEDGFLNNGDHRASGSRSNSQPGKTNWLLLTEQEEGCRYIPQLGDEVVYLRQGHQEYLDSFHLSGDGPWIKYGQNIKDVEVCSVDDVEYTACAGSGESGVKIELRFLDSSSVVCGRSFKLTLPELIDFPDFLVERTRYEASLEKNWNPGDSCSVWWREATGGGNWWDGQICSVGDKSVDFPGSPWERFHVKYEDDHVEYHRHSPWELHHKDSHWEQPGIDLQCKRQMLFLLAKLEQSARGNEDKFGIMKLKQFSGRLDFVNRFPVPLTLEIIELRLKNDYYRSFDAMKHDIMVMLSNVKKYFARDAKMLTKMGRLSDWFDRKLKQI